MNRTVLADTGPIVAALNRRDQHHAWARAQLERLDPPLLTCEAVLTEACFLLRDLPGAAQAALEMVDRGALRITFRLADHGPLVAALLSRYADVPMSLADACLVRMTELHGGSVVWTLDGDFRLYRKNRRQGITTLMPE